MSASREWSELTPANNSKFNQGAAYIREKCEDTRERATVDHYWNSDKTYDGEHKKVTFRDQTVAPGTVSTKSFIYAKNDGTYSLLYMKDGQGNISSLGEPVGVIKAWLPGYFTAAGNVGYTGVTINLPSNYKLCDGSALNDADSPIWVGAGRYLPDIDDQRFLSGNTAGNRGTSGGGEGHYHGMGTGADLNIISSGSHRHYRNSSHLTEYILVNGSSTYAPSAGSTSYATFEFTDYESHTHISANFAGRIGLVTGGVDGNAAGAVLPKYLAVSYIIKVK